MKLEPCIRKAYGRCEHPEDTVARLEPILRERYDYTYVEEQVDEHMHWSAIFIDDPAFRAMGKGTTPVLSKAGALAESAEWLAARSILEQPGYIAAHASRIDAPMLPIDALLSHVAGVTPEALKRIRHLDDAQHWVDGYDLINERTLKLPIEYIRLISGPNGLASGNRREEAMVHALNEIFERRVHITVLRDRLVVPTIDPDTIENPLIREQMAFIESKGIRIVLKDLSMGGVLPCIGAYFDDPAIPEDFQFHHFFKVGASFDLEYALTRVFTEFVQGRRADEFIGPEPEEQARVLRHDFRNLKCMPIDGDNFLSAFMFGFVPYPRADFLSEGERVPFSPGTAYADCCDDIERALDILKLMDLGCYVVDFTDPDIGFPVIQIVVPGYSDVLPYHPESSQGLFRRWTREEVLNSYERGWQDLLWRQ